MLTFLFNKSQIIFRGDRKGQQQFFFFRRCSFGLHFFIDGNPELLQLCWRQRFNDLHQLAESNVYLNLHIIHCEKRR